MAMDAQTTFENEPEPKIEEEVKTDSTAVEEKPEINFPSREKVNEETEKFKDESKTVIYNTIYNIDNSVQKQAIETINSGGGNVSLNEKNNKLNSSNINQILLSVVLSVLSGCRKDIFFEESKIFRNLVIKHLGGNESLFNQNFSELENSNWLTEEDTLLKNLNAIEEDSMENTEYGLSPVKLLKFSDPENQNRILLKFWEVKHSFREPFLEWLVMLGNHRNLNARIKASEVVGKIIYSENTSFDLIVRRVLSVWATSSSRSVKRLISIALSFPIGKDSSASNIEKQILGLLHYWITQGNLSLRETAVMTFSSKIGLQFPEKVIESFNKVTLKEDILLFFPIVETMCDLFEAGEINPELYEAILQTLSEWSSSKEKKNSMRFQISQIILWIIMQQRSSENKRFNTLLWLIKQDKDRYGILLCDLFRQSLFGERLHIDLVFGEMRDWIEICLEDAKYYRSIGFLFVTIIRQGKSNEVIRLLGFLKSWKDDYKIAGAKKILIDIEQYLNMEQKRYVRNI